MEQELQEKGIVLPDHWSIDHLCYRVDSELKYRAKKKEFSEFGQLLIESEVNGRMISTFKLSSSVQFLGRKIDLLELPAPKKHKQASEGFEHVEVVCDKTFSELKKTYKELDFSDKGVDKYLNPELELSLRCMAIKFHHQSLESIVMLEDNAKVYSALKKSEILNKFKKYSPMIVGTIPLGISTKESDLDILLCSLNIDEALEELRESYGTDSFFEAYRQKGGELEYGLSRFVRDGVPFEVYIEKTETLHQRACRHFQVEERLLKLGGDCFKQRILELRKQGLKTEPAFALALGLDGDPYLELLKIFNWSEKKILQLF